MAAGTGRLRRSDRLRRPRDFQRTSRLGERVASRHFVVLIAPSGEIIQEKERSRKIGAQRLGITMSRKVGNAVARNRVKRAVREWFRKERLTLEPHSDLVVIARKEATSLNTKEIVEALQDLTRRATRAK